MYLLSGHNCESTYLFAKKNKIIELMMHCRSLEYLILNSEFHHLT